MDAFYASIEVLDDPSLRGKPVIVGGTPEGRGVVSTASYEARKFGVHSAQPAAVAVRLCPQGIFVRPRMHRYAEVSRQIFEILGRYTPLVEPLSVDEAFLDVTGCRAFARTQAPSDPTEVGVAVELARELQQRVYDDTGGLTCSIGVARNKFLAKLASDLEKPRGVTIVPDENIDAFLAPLAIGRMWGVGPKMAERLKAFGITKVEHAQRLDEKTLCEMIGEEAGVHLAALSHGRDHRRVVPERQAKSISQERTYGEFIPVSERDQIERELFSMSDQVARRLRDSGFWGKTVQLKVRDEKFRTITRAVTLDSPTCLVEEIYETAKALLEQRVNVQGRSIRLLGVGVSKLTTEPSFQLDLLSGNERENAEGLAAAADAIRAKLGNKAITRAWLMEGE